MPDRCGSFVGFGAPDVKTISTLLQTALRADFALPFPEIRYIKLVALVAPQSPVQPRPGFDRQQYKVRDACKSELPLGFLVEANHAVVE
jgi:hypothetical protein